MDPATGDGGEGLTVHQLLQQWAPAYLERFGAAMPARQREVFKKMLSCRTARLGGQLFQCPDCSTFHYRYHSCNDRHCPQCGQADADAWLESQRARLLLPVPYFLVTFTVPEELRRLIRSHPSFALNLLFADSAQALQELAGNPQRLGAQLGLLGVLHTWTRTLVFHPHVHYLIPGGGLSPDGCRWIAARKQFLLHHRALGDHFRTLFKARLLQAQPELFAQVPPEVWTLAWNVGAQAAGSGENALRYLSRYVFKTATGNRTVQRLPQGKIAWTYRESQTRKFRTLPLEPLEFVRRFLQHILPRGFARVRTFGWLHPAAKVRGNRVRALLRAPPVLSAAEKETWQPPAAAPAPVETPAASKSAAATPAKAPLCPCCQQVMRLVGSWQAGQRPRYPNRPP
jgi:hypothetical protein